MLAPCSLPMAHSNVTVRAAKGYVTTHPDARVSPGLKITDAELTAHAMMYQHAKDAFLPILIGRRRKGTSLLIHGCMLAAFRTQKSVRQRIGKKFLERTQDGFTT